MHYKYNNDARLWLWTGKWLDPNGRETWVPLGDQLVWPRYLFTPGIYTALICLTGSDPLQCWIQPPAVKCWSPAVNSGSLMCLISGPWLMSLEEVSIVVIVSSYYFCQPDEYWPSSWSAWLTGSQLSTSLLLAARWHSPIVPAYPYDNCVE